MQHTLNDFFCGCGGMAVGFKKAGYKIVMAWDFDKYAVQSYRENVGDHVEQKDIKEMTWKDLLYADVWAFGFPCQDLSVAGKQAGLQLDCNACGARWTVTPEEYKEENACPNCGNTLCTAANRSGLFFEIMRLIDEVGENVPENLPPVLVAENVKGLRPYIPVLEAEYAKRGYKAYVQLYNSKYWWVPQNRERYYIVGIRDDLAVDFAFPAEQTDFVPKLSTILEKNVDEKYYIKDEKARKIIDQALKKLDKLGHVHVTITPDRIDKRQNGRRAKDDEEEMFTLTAQDLHGVIVADDLQRVYATEDGTAYACTASYGKGLNMNDPSRCRSRTVVIEEPKPEPQINVVGMLDISSHDHSRRVHDPEGLSPTVTAVAGGTRHIKIFDYSRYRVRRLTPTEYGRLQAFPMDTWKQVVSDAQAYKQFGNAVTTTIPEAIGEALKDQVLSKFNKKVVNLKFAVNSLKGAAI